MGFIARVSNPNNQENPKVAGLLKYCIQHEHWSVFEQATMTLEITTTRGLAAQILRHRSFTFQEFSQRYANTNLLGEIPIPDLRRQDEKNRQNSIDDIDPEERKRLQKVIKKYFAEGIALYNELIRSGVAKECARFVLPLATPTKLYMTGSLRSWIHYIELRSANGTQKEHMDVVSLAKRHFVCQFPIISEALEWGDGSCECDELDEYAANLQPCLRID